MTSSEGNSILAETYRHAFTVQEPVVLWIYHPVLSGQVGGAQDTTGMSKCAIRVPPHSGAPASQTGGVVVFERLPVIAIVKDRLKPIML